MAGTEVVGETDGVGDPVGVGDAVGVGDPVELGAPDGVGLVAGLREDATENKSRLSVLCATGLDKEGYSGPWSRSRTVKRANIAHSPASGNPGPHFAHLVTILLSGSA